MPVPSDIEKSMKYAVLINGDRTSELAPSHQRSLSALIHQLTPYGFQSFVLAPEPPEAPSEYIGPFNPDNIETAAKRLRQIATSSDTLLFFTASHGSEEGCLQSDYQWDWLNDWHDRCVSGEIFVEAFQDIPYEQRIVVLTQCFSGDWAKHYIQDPKTLFMSGSVPGASTLHFFNLGLVYEPMGETTTWRDIFASGVVYLRDGEQHTERRNLYMPEIASFNYYSSPPNAVLYYGPLFHDQGPSGLAPLPNAPEVIIDIPSNENPLRYIESLQPGTFAIIGKEEDNALLEDYFARYQGAFYFLRLHEGFERWISPYRLQTFASSFLYLFGYPSTEKGVQILPPMTPYDAMQTLLLNADTAGWNPGGAYASPSRGSGRGCFSGDMYLLSEKGLITFGDYFAQYADSEDPISLASWDPSTHTVIWQKPVAFLQHESWEAPVLCDVPIGNSLLTVTPEHRLLQAPGTEEDWIAVSQFPEFITLQGAMSDIDFNVDRSAIHCRSGGEGVYNLSFTGPGLRPNYLVSPDGEENTFLPAHNLKAM